MHVKAENKAELFNTLKEIDVAGPLMNGTRYKENTEPYAMAHLLSSIAEAKHLLTYPLELIRKDPDRPDFLLKMGSTKIGIEHTEARSENEARKDALRRSEGIGPSVHFVTPEEPNAPSRTTADLRDEIKKNPHKGGFGDPCLRNQKWSQVMLKVIEGKETKLLDPGFTRYDQDWLLIRDAWPAESTTPQNAEQLLSMIQSRKAQLKFNCIFIISHNDRGPVIEITESDFKLHPRNDLWKR